MTPDEVTMSSQPVSPLRIQKLTPQNSPTKDNKMAVPRDLTELAPSEHRRNSPSFTNSSANTSPTKKMISQDSSPFQTSPFNAPAEANSSPRIWPGQMQPNPTPGRFNVENLFKGDQNSPSPSPTRRSSIERLQKASRVKNSTMFAREKKEEYDPTHIPIVERPLAKQIQGNAFDGMGLAGLRSEEKKNGRPWMGHNRTKSDIVSSYTAPIKLPLNGTASGFANNNSNLDLSETATPLTQESPRGGASPVKSALSSTPKFSAKSLYDPEHNTWDDDVSDVELDLPQRRVLHRHAKSVTFDAAPPEINEYEMVTPAPSSIASDGAHSDYDESDDEELFWGRPHSPDPDGDSFDASLEDLSKTPVVGPDDWRRTSLDENHRFGEEYEHSSPMQDDPRGTGSLSPTITRDMSNDHRPLPPLPGMSGSPSQDKPHSALFAAGERASANSSPRPSMDDLGESFTKSDIQGLAGGRMPLEERLRLMMIQDGDEEQKSPAEMQRERRMRRSGNAKVDRMSHTPDHDDGEIKIHEDTDAERTEDERDEVDDTLADLGDYQLPPRISRESILRKVNGAENNGLDSSFTFSSPMPESPDRPAALGSSSLVKIDPDVPLPSTERDNDDVDSMYSSDVDSVIIKPEERRELDLNAIPALNAPRSESRATDNDSMFRSALQDDEDQSVYSEHSHYDEHTPQNLTPPQNLSAPDSGPSTPRAVSEQNVNVGAEVAQVSSLTPKQKKALGLPDFSSFTNQDFGLGLDDRSTPSPPPPALPAKDDIKVDDEADKPIPSIEKEHFPDPGIDRKTTDPIKQSTPVPEIAPCPTSPPPMLSSPPVLKKQPFFNNLPKPDYDGTGWGSDPDDYKHDYNRDDAGTPDSVIHHSVLYESDQESFDRVQSHGSRNRDVTPPMPSMSPVIPEAVATIKSAAGSKLKTRPSITPADAASMKEMRRNISREYPMPLVPAKHQNTLDTEAEEEEEKPEIPELENRYSIDEAGMRKASFKKKSLTLDIGDDLDLGLGLEKEFEHIIEQEKVAFDLSLSKSLHALQEFADKNEKRRQASAARRERDMTSGERFLLKDHYANITPRKQRGYLMRQNTKVVVASSDIDRQKHFREPRSEGNSPVKSQRPQSWTVEPWNGSPRKRSDRHSMVRKKDIGPAPPLPGQKSNVAGGLGGVAEVEEPAEADFENGERGRLFVKVIGVKDLDLPLPRNERTWFALTLDNGVHCVTTAWLELGRNAPIGQEFELVVPNDLEFQLTLNAKLQRPAPKREVVSPTKSAEKKKPSTFSRVFASPRKRKELEMKAKQEEEEAARRTQQELAAKRASQQPTAWDLLSPLAGEDGAFGRSYVCLKDHEARCYGRPYIADITCFNEWALDEDIHSMSSVKSKTGSIDQRRRRAPYKIGKLELQLMFVPKPKGAKEEDMPKSMNSCIRAMKDAEAVKERCFEGFLSQQGGDCPYWRRRLFKLAGSKLTAYHESTGQPRATINLANASKLIDDRRALTQRETIGKGSSRRKSGFAEDEEGYMFVEEGFRIRFQNGEVIDFYAETKSAKEEWMGVLDGVIGFNSGGDMPKWCEEVLKREEAAKRRETRKISAEKREGREKQERERADRERVERVREQEIQRREMTQQGQTQQMQRQSREDIQRPAMRAEMRAETDRPSTGEQREGGKRPGPNSMDRYSAARTRSNTLV